MGLRASDIIFRKIPKLALEPPTAVVTILNLQSCRTELFEEDADVPPTTGNPLIDEALIPHLQCCKVLLQNVGNYGPCKVNEIKAISALVSEIETFM